ncbi:uncharacterized protein K489DRAFT_85784 [Dissoconium aciculare CBS 342.82]|uniref:Uncharacterized protein n=1 Tax=Dissoconium aciculare CBS 342.82 TaxID=1314786 RepID=A0A6J3LWI6_9PEZI|nr:uncharacterized protein K489DRAFT_85784 [Dissoconium aciculare CBS 342.82]KAF1819002.1 hypothetical protein K489DRAFT_85784 [Dissoconium aciculare CBS 342.82]
MTMISKDAVCDILANNMTISHEGDYLSRSHPSFINSPHKKTAADSTIRKLLVHEACTSQDGVREDDHPRFWFEFAQYTFTRPTESTIAAVARCVFHEHAEGAENCYRIKYRAVSLHVA